MSSSRPGATSRGRDTDGQWYGATIALGLARWLAWTCARRASCSTLVTRPRMSLMPGKAFAVVDKRSHGFACCVGQQAKTPGTPNNQDACLQGARLHEHLPGAHARKWQHCVSWPGGPRRGWRGYVCRCHAGRTLSFARRSGFSLRGCKLTEAVMGDVSFSDNAQYAWNTTVLISHIAICRDAIKHRRKVRKYSTVCIYGDPIQTYV